MKYTQFDLKVLAEIAPYEQVTKDIVRQSILSVSTHPIEDMDSMVEIYYNTAIQFFTVCTHCDFMIEGLKTETTGTQTKYLSISEGEITTGDITFVPDENAMEVFSCPLCHEVLFTNRKDALKKLGAIIISEE